MDNIGLDVHKRETQVSWLRATGEVMERRIPTSRERLTALFAPQAPSRILLEASTESEWVAQVLETLGHEVIVADPGFAPMYGRARRVIKTDRRDASALAAAAQTGVYRPVFRVPPRRRAQRALLLVRETLVRTRTRATNVVRALLRQEGFRLPAGTPGRLPARVAALPLPPALGMRVAPLLAQWPLLQGQLAALEDHIAHEVAADPVMPRLQTVPGIGPVTALAFVATLAEAGRFRTAAQVQAYLGLVPREHSSADRQHRGAITKAGPTRLRWLLVEAAWRIRRMRQPEAAALQAWAARIEHRRGRRVAVVALARKLAGILFALWRDGTPYRGGPAPNA
jgi:transposase